MAQNTNRNKRKIVILYSILILSVLAMLGFGGVLLWEIRANSQGQAFFESASVEFAPRPIQPVIPTRPIRHSVEEDVFEEEYIPFVPFLDFDEKREDFPNIVAWIQSAGTVINYPIVHGDDNDFYLHHLPDGTRHRWGSIFLDYRNESDFSDSNIVIYGHYMGTGDMFGSLKYYREQEFFEEKPSMFLFTPHRNYEIVLIAGYDLISTQEVPPMSFADEEDFEAFITDIRNRSVFESPMEVSYGDRLVFMATCTPGGSRHERLILVGVLVEVHL